MVAEFRPRPLAAGAAVDAADTRQGPLVNGLWAVIIGFCLVLTSRFGARARSWRVLNPTARSFLADYGVVIMVVAWSGLSFALDSAPPGVPRRIDTPNTWEMRDTWSTARAMAMVPGRYAAQHLS